MHFWWAYVAAIACVHVFKLYLDNTIRIFVCFSVQLLQEQILDCVHLRSSLRCYVNYFDCEVGIQQEGSN